MRKITDDDIQKYNLSIQDKSPEDILGEKYIFYICRNSYKKLKDSDGNWTRNVEDVYHEIMRYLMGINYEDSWIFHFMSGSSIGREFANGDFDWQKRSENSQMGIIDLSRRFHKQRAKKTKEKLHENVPEFMKENPNPNNPKPELLADHPLRDPYVLVQIQKALGKRIVREDKNRLIVFLILSSMYLTKTMPSTAGLGPSSVGKSMVYNEILKHFPQIKEDFTSTDPAVLLVNNITKASLFRLTSSFIEHKFFYLGELPAKPTKEQEEIDRFIRQLQSDKSISRTVSEQEFDGEGHSEWMPKQLFLEGEIGIIAMSTSNIEEQLSNRLIPLSYDESKAQTKRIINFQALEDLSPYDPAVLERREPSLYLETLVKGLPKRQWELFDFENPFALVLAGIFERLFSDEIQARRVFTFVKRFVELITRIQWLNREIKEDFRVPTGRILIATGEDNLIALELLWQSINQSLFQTKKGDLQYLELIKKAIENNEVEFLKVKKKDQYGYEFEETTDFWTATKMAKTLTKGSSRLRKACYQLQKIGYLESEPMNKSGKSWKYRLKNTENKAGTSDPKRPSDILPFFLPEDMLWYLRFMHVAQLAVRGMAYICTKMLLYSLLFRREIMYHCTDIWFHIYIYNTRVRERESPLKSKTLDYHLLEKTDKTNENKHKNNSLYLLSTSIFSLELRFLGCSTDSTGRELSDGLFGSDARPISTKKSATVEILVEEVLKEFEKGDINHEGMEMEELVQKISEKGLTLTNQEIQDEINRMHDVDGLIHQPKGKGFIWLSD